MRARIPLFVVACLSLTAACTGKGGGGDDDDDDDDGPSVDVQLVRIGGTSTATAVPEGPALFGAAVLDTQLAWSSDVSVSSFKFSLGSITLAGSNGLASVLFHCSTDCELDAAASGAGADLLAGLTADLLDPIQPGTYNRVDVSNCIGPNPGPMKVTAEVDIGGTPWFTDSQSGDGLSTTGPAEELPIFLGAGCGLSYPLPQPLTVGTADALTLRLYFDMDSLMRGATGTVPTHPAYNAGSNTECTTDSLPSDGFLCTQYANIAATIDDGAPVVEHYRINDSAQLGVFFNSLDQFFGGYSRKRYTYGEQGIDFPIGTMTAFSPNGDLVHYTVEEFDNAFTMTDFQRVAVGQTFGGVFLDYAGSSHPYTAERID